jgi:chromosome segregation ATPase
MLGGALAFMGILSILLGLSYRSEGLLADELADARMHLAAAERVANTAQSKLENQQLISEDLESLTAEKEKVLSNLMQNKRQAQKQYMESEKEVGSLLKTSEDKSEELIRRHRRIEELQQDVVRLSREREAAVQLSRERIDRLRQEYEAEIRSERARRESLEEKLGALDEINALRDRLRELVEVIEDSVYSD